MSENSSQPTEAFSPSKPTTPIPAPSSQPSNQSAQPVPPLPATRVQPAVGVSSAGHSQSAPAPSWGVSAGSAVPPAPNLQPGSSAFQPSTQPGGHQLSGQSFGAAPAPSFQQTPTTGAIPQASAAEAPLDTKKANLFDLSFRGYAAPFLAKIIYIFSIIVIVLSDLATLFFVFAMMSAGNSVASFAGSPSSSGIFVFLGFFMFIGIILHAALSIMVVRAVIEFFLATIRTADNSELILQELRQRH